VPPGRLVVVPLTLPFAPSVNSPVLTVVPADGWASSDTVPVAVPLFGVTLIVVVTFSDPCAIPVVGDSANVVVVGTVATVPQVVARFPTFSDPSPVAMS
jgi:hypothetical protein